jgi:hypothetical protein
MMFRLEVRVALRRCRRAAEFLTPPPPTEINRRAAVSLTPPPPTIGRRAAVCAKNCLFARLNLLSFLLTVSC